MAPCANPSQGRTIAVLGGTGRFGAPYIRTFMDQGLRVRILARSPNPVRKRFPAADVRRGNMLNRSDVEQALDGTEAAFLITPVGGNDDIQIELRAVRCTIAAAKAVRLLHLIYLSLIQPLRPTGIPMLDVKGRIERLLVAGSVPFSILRTGCYMDTWLSFFPLVMNLGLYLMPIGPRHRFSFTAQQDVARLAVALMRRHQVLNAGIDVIDPQPRSLIDVVTLYQAVKGKRLIPLGPWLLPVVTLLRPVLFRWAYPSGASRVRLFHYFNENDWIGDARQLTAVMPEFHVTSMRDFLRERYRDGGKAVGKRGQLTRP